MDFKVFVKLKYDYPKTGLGYPAPLINPQIDNCFVVPTLQRHARNIHNYPGLQS